MVETRRFKINTMKYPILSLVLAMFLLSCNAQNQEMAKIDLSEYPNTKTAVFASGCFWCVEAIFESVKGVKEVYSGYAGGTENNPTYGQVSSGRTSHTESVLVIYDPKIVSYQTLLEVFYGSHNPTTVNGQHPDYGTQYRSGIYYQSEEEKALATAYRDSLQASGTYEDPIATEIAALKKFWPAEEYHQDFEHRNPNQPYVKAVSVPRLNRFKAKFPGLLK